MAVVTVLAVFAVPRVAGLLPGLPRPGVRQVVAVVVVLGLLAATLPIVYPSPYVYKENRMVSEQQLTGHETLFEHEAPGTEVASVRLGPYRSYHAIYGVETTSIRTGEMARNDVPFKNLSRLQSLYDSDHYVAITDNDRQREVTLYENFRYEASGFDSLDWQRDVHRPISNGEFRSYLVDTGGESP